MMGKSIRHIRANSPAQLQMSAKGSTLEPYFYLDIRNCTGAALILTEQMRKLIFAFVVAYYIQSDQKEQMHLEDV